MNQMRFFTLRSWVLHHPRLRMWNEEIDVSEHMLRVAKVSCPILRKEVSKSFAQVFSAIREALRWHLILMQRQTILMLRLGLRKTILALAFQQRKGIAAYEPPVVNGSDSPNAEIRGGEAVPLD